MRRLWRILWQWLFPDWEEPLPHSRSRALRQLLEKCGPVEGQ